MISKKKAAGKSTRGSIKTVKSTKDDAKPPQVLEGIGTLPEHVRLSDEELVMTVRFVRALRRKERWEGHFISWLIWLGEERTPESNRDSAIDLLHSLKQWTKLGNWTQDRGVWPFRDYYGHRYFPDRVDEDARRSLAAADFDEEDQFRELVELWRKDHPAPMSKYMQAPASWRAPAKRVGD